MSRSFEQLEHTADILIRATGDTLAEAFEAAAEALFAVITDDEPIQGDFAVSFRINSDDQESLLVKMLSELIVRHEVDNVVLTDFTVTFESKLSLEVNAKGERFDETRHSRGHHVKGVSYHLLEIIENPVPSVRILFDV